MFKFLHAADIHLDSPLRGIARYQGMPVDDIRLATRRAFDNLVKLAIEEKVRFVLLAGDLYDGDWKDTSTGMFFSARLTRLREAGVKVFLVAGNHDAANRMTKSLRLPENATVFSARQPETIPLPEGDVVIHGLDSLIASKVLRVKGQDATDVVEGHRCHQPRVMNLRSRHLIGQNQLAPLGEEFRRLRQHGSK